jgi:hypothetical protein
MGTAQAGSHAGPSVEDGGYVRPGLEYIFEIWEGNSGCHFVQEHMRLVFESGDGKIGGFGD